MELVTIIRWGLTVTVVCGFLSAAAYLASRLAEYDYDELSMWLALSTLPLGLFAALGATVATVALVWEVFE